MLINMKELSSQAGSTFSKFVLPIGFFIVLPFWIYLVFVSRSVPWFVVAFWACALVFLLWMAIPIKRVWLNGDVFMISDFRRTIEVSASRLVRIKEERWNRTPNISLFFDPPTEFGRKVTIIVPWDHKRRQFDEVALLCRGFLTRELKRSGGK